MQMQAQAQFQEPVEFEVIEPVKTKTGSRFIFYAGDVISPLNKLNDPRFKNGGIVVTNLTLSHVFGFIERCRIVEMRQAMQSVAIANVHPDKREDYVPTYQIPVGRDPQTGERILQTIGLKANGEHDGLLRRAVYPADDITSLTAQNIGIVEMPVTNQREKLMAENFLFPEGVPSEFPDTIEKLKRYFEGRFKAAPDSFCANVAVAAIQSCEQIATTGLKVTLQAASDFDAAKTKAWAWTIPAEAAAYYDMLGKASPAEATRAKDDKFDKLVEMSAQQATLFQQIVSAGVQATANQSPTAPVTVPPPTNQNEKQIEKGEAENGEINTHFAIGEKVLAQDREGEVTGKPGGRITVKFDSGETKTFEKSDVRKLA